MCWKITLTPKPDAPVVWGKLFYWVRKADYLPARIDYYDENGELIRYMTFSDYRIMDERKIPTVWMMHDNVEKGKYTRMQILEMEFNINIPERRFSFRELERGS